MDPASDIWGMDSESDITMASRLIRDVNFSDSSSDYSNSRDDLSEYEGLTILINSLLIKYLNKVTMTDSMRGRGLVIKNITLNNIKCEMIFIVN